MPPSVEEDVPQSQMSLARSLDDSQVIAVGEHVPSATQELVEIAGQPNGERLDAARERLVPIGLDQQVQVILLDRVLDHCEVSALAGELDRRLHDSIRLLPPHG